MHAYDKSEVDRLKGYGWSVEVEAPAKTTPAPAPVVFAKVEDEPKKRGRPHKK